MNRQAIPFLRQAPCVRCLLTVLLMLSALAFSRSCSAATASVGKILVSSFDAGDLIIFPVSANSTSSPFKVVITVSLVVDGYFDADGKPVGVLPDPLVIGVFTATTKQENSIYSLLYPGKQVVFSAAPPEATTAKFHYEVRVQVYGPDGTQVAYDTKDSDQTTLKRPRIISLPPGKQVPVEPIRDESLDLDAETP